MGLQHFIAERKKDKDLLVMAHVVCGYPSFEAKYLKKHQRRRT